MEKGEVMGSILILGTERDPHVARVARALEARGVKAIVADYLRQIAIDFRMDRTGRHVLKIGGKSLDEPFLIWDRLKLIPGSPLFPPGQEREADWCAMEWRAFFRLVTGLYRDRVYNTLESRSCLVKPYQQMLAARAGFLVPATAIATRKRPLQRFARETGACIIKSLSAGKVRPRPHEQPIPYNIFTLPLDSDTLRKADPEGFRLAPHFVQERIEKDHELRVEIVGRQVFAFRIDSQKVSHGRIDWRHAIGEVTFEPVTASQELCSKLLAFMTAFGLFSGGADIVVDPLGRYWFIECNQDGQWAWLDDIVDGAITRAFAEEFAGELARRFPEAEG
ncbi:MAG: hypothetical protein D6740_08455, partial [Alphaproteobacteria bacterium]